ncbi:STAS/SEC14 domain-containing protein [uncultured Erythrobacter sp.]|uniref:STAS/SEC14 domain-containing protein n=1 Tax=uncultured Erythrobacter sp. TaxID=263913 RepID=UPI00260A6870|nr:STAS/SEC14 domain-containing protein [uncultured Erythrobacter sp.]
MIEIETIAPHAHRIIAIAEFRQGDVKTLLNFVKERNESDGGGNLLIDVTSMASFSFSAVAEEIGHMGTFMKYIYGLDRIAIISDEKWIRTAARLESALLPRVVYQVYDDDEAEAARAWVLEETDQPHRGAFREIDSGNPAIAAYELSGRLDREESERGVAMVRAALEAPECSRLMMVIRHWHGFDPDAAISRKVMVGKLELLKNLERYAIVGGPAWIGNLAGFFGALVKPAIKSFDLDEQDEAIAWLSEGLPDPEHEMAGEVCSAP